jgi:predicted aldo/keto reductase-like oxidoreductase
MRQMVLGRSGLSVSAVGLGGVQFSKITPKQVSGVIGVAIDCGITFFETAYGYFDSEEKMGPALRGKRKKIILASKSWVRDGKTIAKHMDESLARLKTDYLDIYQLHGVDRKEDLEQALARNGALAAVLKAQKAGKVRSIGMTSHSMDRSLAALKLDLFDTLQYPISLINTEIPRSGLLKLARQNNVGLIAMKPLGGGRIDNPRLALGYVYRYGDVVPVVGVETPEQVRELAKVADKPPTLSAKDMAAIVQIRRTLGKSFCRACRYCEPCPRQINIFQGMYLPIYLKQMGEARFFRSGYPTWLEKVEDCTACRACENRCPFHLRIVSSLKKNATLARKAFAAQSESQ